MAEARSAVGKIHVLPDSEGKGDTWKDVYNAIRKSIVRRYYRTRLVYLLMITISMIYLQASEVTNALLIAGIPFETGPGRHRPTI